MSLERGSVPSARRMFTEVWRDAQDRKRDICGGASLLRSGRDGLDNELGELSQRHNVKPSRVAWKADAERWLQKRNKTIAPELSAVRKAELRQLFRIIDQDGSGLLDEDELRVALSLCGMNDRAVDEALDDIYRRLRKERGRDALCFSEFCLMFSHQAREAQQRPGEQGVSFSTILQSFRRRRALQGLEETESPS